MPQSLKKDLQNKLIDSMCIIRGGAQLAKEAKHIEGCRKYLEIIIREIDHASSLLNEAELTADYELHNRKINYKKTVRYLNLVSAP